MTGALTLSGRPVPTLSDETLAAHMALCHREYAERRGVRRYYRPNPETMRIYVAVIRFLDEVEPPATVRQVFYGLETRGIVEKSESGYRRVQEALVTMRRAEMIPYRFISDNTRWIRRPTTYRNLSDSLKEWSNAYRRQVWADQAEHVEIWIEKDALAGVAADITGPWDVPLIVTRGYPSDSYLHQAAELIASDKKPAIVYYFGDYDPSGVNISVNSEEKLIRDHGVELTFIREALNRDQVEAWNLPTRPTKRSDSRSGRWRGGSVELDAVPVQQLRRMIETAITRHIDRAAYDRTMKAEAMERETLESLVINFRTSQEIGSGVA
jgi:hypothetical protein